MICKKCNQPIPISQHGKTQPGIWGTENGLHMFLDGGYGEFMDAWDGQVRVDLCHECAHDLADWLGLDVHNWHTHVAPEHGGTQHANHDDYFGGGSA